MTVSPFAAISSIARSISCSFVGDVEARQRRGPVARLAVDDRDRRLVARRHEAGDGACEVLLDRGEVVDVEVLAGGRRRRSHRIRRRPRRRPRPCCRRSTCAVRRSSHLDDDPLALDEERDAADDREADARHSEDRGQDPGARRDRAGLCGSRPDYRAARDMCGTVVRISPGGSSTAGRASRRAARGVSSPRST